ncbi:MAG: 3,4-dehydroadipyl-CoA semialdehyde dehydrogenase [Alphaproteobacteria bacterium]|nr:3,4-dehydroadipyl-CoA semialdehyde dehydrogenase [Alphaproteobacteria bacterium]
MQRLTSFLENRWVDGQAPHTPLHDATTGYAVAETSTRGLDLGAALAHARTVGGRSLRALTFAERGAMLGELARCLHTHRDALLDLSRQNYGATRSDGKFDVDGAAGTLAFYARLGADLGDRRFLLDGEAEGVGRSARFVGQHLLTPRRGVALHINAFNFPAWGMAEKLAVSLLAGVPALVKPATATALVTWRIVQLWQEEDLLPEGAVSLLCGSAGDLLDHLQPQDVIAFTGSSTTGRTLRGHPRVVELGIPVNVEADSLNAFVLGPDAEPGEPTFEMFARELVHELTQKAGQKCTAVRRVLVPVHLLDDVREAVADHLSRQGLGDPASKDVRIGPVATADQHAAVTKGVAELEAFMDTFVAWEGDLPDHGWFVRPQLFLTDQGVHAAFVHDEEVFGPVATVLSYSGDPAEAVAIVARGGGGLVCSVYSDDAAWATEVVGELAPWHGRIQWGSAKVADQGMGPGTVLPGFVHGGPGKAGGGEELGGLRGMRFYQQRTAVQGDRVLLERAFGTA